MKGFTIALTLALTALMAPGAHAKPRHAKEARSESAIVSSVAWRHHHLVINADQSLQARLMTLSAPSRVVIDLYGAELSDPSLAQAMPIGEEGYQQVRVALHPEEGFVRFVIDCTGEGAAAVKLDQLDEGRTLVVRPKLATVAEKPTAPEPSRPVFYGPELPPDWLVYGPPVPLSHRIYGPPRPEVTLAKVEPGEPTVSRVEPDAAETDDQDETSTRSIARPWDGAPQAVSEVSLKHRKGHTMLQLVGDRAISASIAQQWAPPRVIVRVPKGAFHGKLPEAIKGVESLSAEQSDGDWVLTLALERGVYRIDSHRSGHDLTLDWQRQELSERRPTVIVDAGHGGDDPGAIGPSGSHESMATLGLARAVQAALVDSGKVNVVMTRTSDSAVDLASRARLTEALHPALFVSMHGNSCATSETGGLETYYRNDVSLPLARHLHRLLVERLQRPDRGVRQARLYVLRSPSVPSVLIESAYLSNPDEEKLLGSERFQREVGKAVAEGILSFLDKTPVAELPPGR